MFIPVILGKVSICSYHLLDFSFPYFRLTIGLRMICSEVRYFCLKLFEQRFPEITHEYVVSVVYDFVRESVVSVNMKFEEFGDNWCICICLGRHTSQIIFDNLQTTFNIPVRPFFVIGNGAMNSMVLVFLFLFGIGVGCKNPNSL